MTKIGVLTGGGDAPGLNAAIRAVVRRASMLGWEVLGIRRGWAGVLEMDVEPLTVNTVAGILPRGGTILGTSRTNPFKNEETAEKAIAKLKEMKLDALVAIGGEDTLGAANKLWKRGIPVVGIPKTIDNDLEATDDTIGFDTAVNIVMEAIDRLHTTAESHNRVIVVEVMGRHAGWVAVEAGIAGGADIILIPEEKYDIDQVAETLKKRHARGRNFSIVVVAEGAEEIEPKKKEAVDEFGHVRLGGVGEKLAAELQKRTGFETRVTVLGHTQRGGSPTARDRLIATRYGVGAVELIRNKKFGRMVAMQGGKMVDVPLEAGVGKLKLVDKELYEVAKVFFG
ncbi:MAG: ATP-dependent 6-phosphofructokinase [Thermoplasmata archaeon]